MSATTHILHLDDNPGDAELVAMALAMQKEEFPAEVQYVQNQKQFLAALERRDFDIILSDYRMPEFDGEKALKAAKERCPEIPFIMVTGELGEELVIETLKRGATDYVLKDRIFRLIPAIKRALAEAEIERKRHEAEVALRKSEAKLRAVFHALVEGVVFLNPQGNVEEANDAVRQTHHYTLRELVNPGTDPGRKVIRPDGTPFPFDEQPAMVALRTGKAVRDVELGVPASDGTVQWTLVNAQPVHDDRGARLGAVASFFDITDRKRAEEALRESEQRLRATFNNAALGIVEADVSGHFLAVNDRICSILGYSRQELLQKTIRELTAPEDREESDKLNAQLLAGAMEMFDYEKRYLHRDGSRLWVHLTVSAVRDGSGNIVRAIGTVEDVSARKQAEEKVKDVARFPDENPSPVMRVGEDGVILYANPASRRLLKKWKAEGDGKLPRTVKTSLAHALSGKNSRAIDLKVAESVLSVLVVPVRDRGYVNLYGRDVTELRHVEQALIAAKQEAERRAGEAEQGRRILDALMEYIPVGITIASAPDAITLKTSRYADELLMKGWSLSEGLSMEQWLSRVEHYLADGHTTARVEDLPLWRAARYGEQVEGEELVLGKPNGQRISVLCNAGPIRDRERNIIGAVVAWRDVSERKGTEAALLESENPYRSMVEHSHAVMLLVDPESGKIIDANPAAARYYGWSRAELASMTIDQINVLSREEIAAEMTDAKHARRSHFTFRHRRSGGDIRDVEVYSGPVEVHGRKLLHSIIHDVSGRREAEDRLLLHLENSPLAVIEWDKDFSVTRWSKEATRLFGYKSDETIGRRIDGLQLVHPEDIPVVEQTILRLSTGSERTVVSENRNVTKEGKTVHCVWHNSVLTDPEGMMSSVLSLVQDVTAERSAKASLEKTIKSLRVLVTNSSEHMLLLDSEGAVLCSSRHAASALGFGAKELEGKNWEVFVPQEQLIHARFFYRDMMRNPAGRITAALTLLTASGEKALFSLSASRVALGDTFGYLTHVERVTTQGSQELTRVEEIPVPSAPNHPKRLS